MDPLSENCLSPTQVAKLLHVRRAEVERLIQTGELRAFRLPCGKRQAARVPVWALREWQERQCVAQSPAPKPRRGKSQEVYEYIK